MEEETISGLRASTVGAPVTSGISLLINRRNGDTPIGCLRHTALRREKYGTFA
jgi:hypothetical protein